jgi:hypothetical protein
MMEELLNRVAADTTGREPITRRREKVLRFNGSLEK